MAARPSIGMRFGAGQPPRSEPARPGGALDPDLLRFIEALAEAHADADYRASRGEAAKEP
jgi:hypothetical protein